MKHIPERTCIVCRRQRPKSELIRIVKTPTDEIALDIGARLPGRGAYICRDGECAENLAKKRALDRTFKTQVSTETYGRILQEYAELIKDAR